MIMKCNDAASISSVSLAALRLKRAMIPANGFYIATNEQSKEAF